MPGSKLALIKALLFGPLIPTYNDEYEGAVAIIAVPFNCYLRNHVPDETNAAIARIVFMLMEQHDLPFVGQWEHANLLLEWGREHVIMFPSSNGERVESQRLIAFQAREIRERFGGAKVILVGMPEHLGRCTALARYYGLKPVVAPDSKGVPYDHNGRRPGAQWWCLNRTVFTWYERLVGRPGSVVKLVLGLFPK